MQIANKLMMISVSVANMAKSKAFYVKKLGFEISTEYRQDDNNWWTGLTLPEGSVTLTLSRAGVSPESIKPGALTMYFETSDIDVANKELRDKGVEAGDVQNDLFGPGSNVKWFSMNDPDNNQLIFAEKHDPRAPF
jgi:catechol 2,3-dioxygenase-like lactoylglutathione lyase family enzyme